MFCLETERSISNDWVVRYENRYFQLERGSDYPPRQAKVTVCEWENGRIEIRYQGKAQAHHEIECTPEGAGGDPAGAEASAPSVALEATSEPSLEEARLRGGDEASHCLRFALNARPSGLAGRSSGSAPPLHRERTGLRKKRKGTFLAR